MDQAEDLGGLDAAARGGIQALDAAIQVLQAFAALPGPVGVTDLARAAGMPVSKVHRYLASFVHAGLAVQDGRSGRYDLGPFAATLGVAALARNDFINRAADGLADLCLRTGLTALLTVWGSHGATVVRWQRAPSPVVTSFGLGSTLPLLTSASGRVFLSFLPRRLTEASLRAEVSRLTAATQGNQDFEASEAGIEALTSGIRKARMASVDGRYVPGLRAVSAPVLNWQKEAEVAVTLIGTESDILLPGSEAQKRLYDFVDARSIRAR